jgi:hypothetical protein
MKLHKTPTPKGVYTFFLFSDILFPFFQSTSTRQGEYKKEIKT